MSWERAVLPSYSSMQLSAVDCLYRYAAVAAALCFEKQLVDSRRFLRRTHALPVPLFATRKTTVVVGCAEL